MIVKRAIREAARWAKSMPVLRPIGWHLREHYLRWYRMRHPYVCDNYQFIFVIGHMRSGSTLLTRILSSHPEICGYGEMHRSYPSPEHFINLYNYLSYLMPDKLEKSRYLLDKVLHQMHELGPSVLEDHRVKLIVLVRDPCDSIHSMVARLKDTEWEGNPQVAGDYFVEQMRWLEQLPQVAEVQGRMKVITYEELVEFGDEVLSSLSQFLELKQALTPAYEVDKETGRWGVGDASENIFQGKIVRIQPQRASGVPAEVQQHAAKAYQRMLFALSAFRFERPG